MKKLYISQLSPLMQLVFLGGLMFLWSIGSVRAQDFQYSLFHFTPINVNPALVGANNDQDASLIYRHQRLGAEAGLHSSQINLTHPLISKKRGRWAGVGLQVADDRTGESSFFTRQSIMAAFAYNFNLSATQSFSVGLSAGYNTRSISSGNWRTGAQWAGSRFNSHMLSGEDMEFMRQTTLNVSAGLHYRKVDGKGRESMFFGMSLLGFNKPVETYTTAQAIPSTFLFNGGITVYSNDLIAVTPLVLYTNRAGSHFINSGAKLNYSLEQFNSNIISDQGSIDFGLSYVNEKAAVVSVTLNQPSYNVGFSYDIDFNPLSPVRAFGGAPEFAIRFFRTFDAKISKKIKKKAKKKKKKKTSSKKKSTNTATRTVKQRTVPVEKIGEQEELKEATPVETAPVKAAPVPRLKPEEFLNRNIYFDFNEAIFENKEASEFLNRLALFLEQHPEQNIRIIGHTDNIGKAQANKKLSLRRAQSVHDYLVERGVDPARLSVEGRGANSPLVPNTSDENRAQNRRVEIIPEE